MTIDKAKVIHPSKKVVNILLVKEESKYIQDTFHFYIINYYY